MAKKTRKKSAGRGVRRATPIVGYTSRTQVVLGLYGGQGGTTVGSQGNYNNHLVVPVANIGNLRDQFDKFAHAPVDERQHQLPPNMRQVADDYVSTYISANWETATELPSCWTPDGWRPKGSVGTCASFLLVVRAQPAEPRLIVRQGSDRATLRAYVSVHVTSNGSSSARR